MNQPLEKCPACGFPRTNEGQPSRRYFFGCGSYYYAGDVDITYQSLMCAELEERRKILNSLENMAREHCHTAKVDRDYNGQIAGSLVTDSGAISANAAALEILAQAGRFRVIAAGDRMVVGYWPENDPEKKTTATETTQPEQP